MTDQDSEQNAGGSSLARWIAIALLLAGVVAFYYFGAQPAWLRWLYVLGGFAAAAFVFWTYAGGRDFQQFAVDARNELRKVFWPTRQETWMTTAVVFGFAVIMGLFFWLLDLFLAWATRLLTGQGG
jgi:preprotein translocase subunit SecE